MEEKHLHIIAFNVPYPPNYGGVIDVYYKLRALSKTGIKLHLHAFQYGRKEAEKLYDYCETVCYYPRKLSLSGIFGKLPLIVSSRNDKLLLNNLRKDNHPILFEGLHSTFFINQPKLENRLKLVRMHNVEWQYYQHLAKLEGTWYKKLYFNLEAKRLKTYESSLKHANKIIAISHSDAEYYSVSFPRKTCFIPAFHENEKVQSVAGKGDYVLYHGDLSVKDNEAAALHLISEVFSKIKTPLIIAGLNPGKALVAEVHKHENISLKANLDSKEMRKLIVEAHVNLLFSFQSAGMKLKLLNALYLGKHCIANDQIIGKSEMGSACIIKNTGPEIIGALTAIMDSPFNDSEIQKRRALLHNDFSNEQNAKKLAGLI